MSDNSKIELTADEIDFLMFSAMYISTRHILISLGWKPGKNDLRKAAEIFFKSGSENVNTSQH